MDNEIEVHEDDYRVEITITDFGPHFIKVTNPFGYDVHLGDGDEDDTYVMGKSGFETRAEAVADAQKWIARAVAIMAGSR